MKLGQVLKRLLLGLVGTALLPFGISGLVLWTGCAWIFTVYGLPYASGTMHWSVVEVLGFAAVVSAFSVVTWLGAWSLWRALRPKAVRR